MDETVMANETASAEIISRIDDLNKQAWDIHITQPKLSLDVSSEAKELSEKYFYRKGLAYAIRNMGVSNRYLSNLEMALTLSIQALEMFVQIDDKSGEAQTFVSIGSIYYYMGDYEKSADFFVKGLRCSEEAGNREALAYAYNGAGYNYGVIFGDHKKGLEFLEKALVLSKEVDAPSDLQPRVLDSMAEVYMNSGQMEKAYEASLECLRLCDLFDQKMMKGDALFTLGLQLFKQNKLAGSTEYFCSSIKEVILGVLAAIFLD